MLVDQPLLEPVNDSAIYGHMANFYHYSLNDKILCQADQQYQNSTSDRLFYRALFLLADYDALSSGPGLKSAAN